MPWDARISYFCFIPLVLAHYTPAARWGQAAALLENVLYIHGGLSDPYNSYSYTSAPETSDVLLLDLSTSFDASNPPWQLLSVTSSPALAWHTLSAFNTTHLLLFGGQPGADSQTVLTTRNDSAILLSALYRTNPAFTTEPQSWAGEPTRRIRHGASSMDGRVWIVGGEKADGSGNAFAEHYVFDPFVTEFTPLPSNQYSPPDIYGHASVVLTDGRFMVLGGYCTSCSKLVPMNMVWCLDTTKVNSGWQLLSVSNTSVPDPRRDFAAIALPNGNILIHGGGDAQLEQTYSDGWILDTSQSPMTWHSVEALSQIGARKDHTAIQAGGLVLICFGYGSSAPAPASLLVYNPVSSALVSWFTAPSPAVGTVQSLPGSTQTSGWGASPGSGNGGGVQSGSAPSSEASTSYLPGPSNATTGTNPMAIALGTTFGFLGLVAGVVIVYYVKRSHRRHPMGQFAPLNDDFEYKPGDTGLGTVAVPVTASRHTADGRETWSGVGIISGVLAYLGIRSAPGIPHRPRRDMFADEDTRSSTWGGRLGVSLREGSEGTSAWSLRSMGAVVRGMMSREPSTSGTAGDRDDKLGHIEQEEQLARIQEKNASERSSSNLQVLGGGWIYDDPFADPQQEDDYPDLGLRPGPLEQDEEYDRPISHGGPLEDYDLNSVPSLKITLPLSFPPRTLGPLQEDTHTLDPSGSPQSVLVFFHDEPPISPCGIKTPVSSTLSRPSHSPSLDASPLQSLLSKHPLPPSQLMRRSDSWWARFAKTPLLDRRSSVTPYKPPDFRDPAPPPSLAIIEEVAVSKACLASSNSTLALQRSELVGEKYVRSVSSAHSVHTANTEAAERLVGSYDVVQRALSEASLSHHTLASTIFDTFDTSDTAAGSGTVADREHGLLAVNRSTCATPEASLRGCDSLYDEPVMSAPPQMLMLPDLLRTTSSIGTQSWLKTPASTTNIPHASSKPSDLSQSTFTSFPARDGGYAVLHKVFAYERRLSHDLETQLPSPPQNTRKREEMPARSRPTIHYGLAPRASLFVANPDMSDR